MTWCGCSLDVDLGVGGQVVVHLEPLERKKWSRQVAPFVRESNLSFLFLSFSAFFGSEF